MIDAVLTDLDGTLLEVDMNTFIPEYLAVMQKEALRQGVIDAGRELPGHIWRCTGQVLENQDPAMTNEDVFMRHFFADPYYGKRKGRMLAFFKDFYERVFPVMRTRTAPAEQGKELISRLEAFGKPLILATNPLFPLLAIRYRIEWAGLDPKSFAWITAYENMHSTKPHLSYYQEICDRFALDPARCVMIGNDDCEDVVPGELGMRTYLLEDHPVHKTDRGLKPTWRGSMRDFIAGVVPALAAEAAGQNRASIG